MERVAGYAFAWGSPVAWLLDWIPEPAPQAPLIFRQAWGYFIIVWIPAALYSAILYFGTIGFHKMRRRS
jgi:hypothetical protein